MPRYRVHDGKVFITELLIAIFVALFGYVAFRMVRSLKEAESAKTTSRTDTPGIPIKSSIASSQKQPDIENGHEVKRKRDDARGLKACFHKTLNYNSFNDKREDPIDREVLIKSLKKLKPSLEERKPKKCTPILEEIITLQWPESLHQEIEDLIDFTDKYQYREAITLFESMICKLEENQSAEN